MPPTPAADRAPADAAVLEAVAPGRLEDELRDLDPALRARGLTPTGALQREVTSGRVAVVGAALVAGRLPFVREALRRHGVAVPAPLDYAGAGPAALGRRVWPSTLGAVAVGIELRGEPVFVKPRGVAKQFTGRVVHDETGLRALPVRSPRTPVWCSEVVDIVAEHRVFIRHGEAVGVRQYDGDASATPPAAAVDALLDEVRPALTAGCALDVAVLADGCVVLVELNDGYALGRYGLDSDAYAGLLLARWSELVTPTT